MTLGEIIVLHHLSDDSSGSAAVACLCVCPSEYVASGFLSRKKFGSDSRHS